MEWATGFPLNKDFQTSNWNLEPLTYEQKMYASLDVLAPLLVVQKFAEQSQKWKELLEN